MFGLEMGFSADTGVMDTPPFRNSYVGMSSGRFGTIGLGRLDSGTAVGSPIYTPVTRIVDLVGYDSGSTAISTAILNSRNRTSNSIGYASPEFAGFTVRARGYLRGTDVEGQSTARSLDLGLEYAQGPFYAAVNYGKDERKDGLRVNEFDDKWQIGARYTFGAIAAYGLVGQDRYNNTVATRREVDYWLLGGSWTAGVHKVLVNVMERDVQTTLSGERRRWQAAYIYAVSKRTELQAFFDRDGIDSSKSNVKVRAAWGCDTCFELLRTLFEFNDACWRKRPAGTLAKSSRRDTMFRRHFLLAIATTAAASPVQAQSWPTKPIRLIVGYPPGGPVDGIARLLAPAIGKELGQPLIVDNKPGAAGGLGITATVQADPDGHTFGIGVLGIFAVAPHVSKLPYKPEEVNYVTMLTRSPHVLVTNPTSGMKDLNAFVEAARSNPGQLNYGSPGQGSSTHLDGELLQAEARIDILHVPYKGGTAAINALLAGEIQLLAAEISAALPLKSKLKIVAVMGDTRVPQLPDVPTTKELGYPGVVASSMYGIIAPTKTPTSITEKFRVAVHRALAQPEIRDRLLSQGQTPMPTTSKEYRALMASESARWGDIIKDRKIRFE